MSLLSRPLFKFNSAGLLKAELNTLEIIEELDLCPIVECQVVEEVEDASLQLLELDQ
jgi:hypothetical protein